MRDKAFPFDKKAEKKRYHIPSFPNNGIVRWFRKEKETTNQAMNVHKILNLVIWKTEEEKSGAKFINILIVYLDKNMESTLFKQILFLCKRNKGRLILATCLVLLANLFLIANPLLLRQAISIIDGTKEVPYPVMQRPFFWMLLLLGLTLLSGLCRYTMRMLFMLLSWKEEERIRSLLFERIQRQSSAFFDRHPTGDLLSRLTNDMTAFSDVLGPGLLFPIFCITLAVPAFIALFWISLPLGCLALFPMTLVPVILIGFRTQLFSLSQEVQRSLATLSTMTQENFSGITLVKSYGAEERSLNKFWKEGKNLESNATRFSTYQGALYPLISLLFRIITLLLVAFMGVSQWYNWKNLSGTDFISFMWIQSYTLVPFLMIGWIFPFYQKGKAAYERLFILYDEPLEIVDDLPSSLRIPPSAPIRIDNLSFTYPKGDKPTLHNLSCTIEGGSFVGITGPIGAGKTTLFRLLCREYEIPKKKIFLGEHDIHEYPLEAFSEAIVQVEQIPFLFSRTIGENIAFAKESSTQEELDVIAKETELHETIHSFPYGYETPVGERGVTLSGGQKQRISMARAFFVNRSMVFLDDIFSAVDSNTEQKIFASLQKRLRGKTVLLITHRPTILEQMDLVLYMIDGQIVEKGSPKTLKKIEGHYSALVDLHRGTT